LMETGAARAAAFLEIAERKLQALKNFWPMAVPLLRTMLQSLHKK